MTKRVKYLMKNTTKKRLACRKGLYTTNSFEGWLGNFNCLKKGNRYVNVHFAVNRCYSIY